MSAGSIMTIINSLFFILGGVTVFMVGMEMMGANLEKAAGKSMRRLMAKATRNRFVGVGTGAVVTALVNSSSATTVMIVGFVNVGFMTLVQASSIIMGANIGTTISALIMALSSSSGSGMLEIAALFALVAFAGFVVNMVGKSDKIKRIGYILQGLGLIFLGLHVMSSAVKILTGGEGEVKTAIENMFISLGRGKDVLTWEIPVLFLVGAILTALMQSSGAVTAIVVTLASGNLITFPMAIFITLGTNVGTCFTSVLSSLSGNSNAKRTAVIHLLFNVIGSIIFIIPLSFLGTQLGDLFAKTGLETQWQIAIFHMFFNILTTAMLLPFQKQLVQLACLIIPQKEEQKSTIEILDARLLKSPPIAVGQTRQEICRMAEMAFGNYKRSLDMLLSLNLSTKEKFDETEEEINRLNKYITSFLVKLSARDITENDERKVGSFYHVVSDIERIGDYATNITEYAEQMIEDKKIFSDHAKQEVLEMDTHISNLYGYVSKAFIDRDLSQFDLIEQEEQLTDDMKVQMKASHIRRLTEGHCDAETGAIFLQLAADMERIGDHMKNIANSVKEYTR